MPSCRLLPRGLACLSIAATIVPISRSIGHVWTKTHLALLLLIALAIAPHSSTAAKAPPASMSGTATSGACSSGGSSEVQVLCDGVCMNMYTATLPSVSWRQARRTCLQVSCVLCQVQQFRNNFESLGHGRDCRPSTLSVNYNNERMLLPLSIVYQVLYCL